jgi:hypothetical protein
MRQRLKVTPIESEIMRFLVDSQREGVPPYLVDLESLDCLGACSCTHYEVRIYPMLKSQLHLNWRDRTQINCIHLLAAKEYFLNEILHGLSEKLSAEPEQKIIIGKPQEIEKPKRESTRFGFFQRFLQWKSPDENK